MQYIAAESSTVPYISVQYSTAQYNTVQYNMYIAQCVTVQWSKVQ